MCDQVYLYVKSPAQASVASEPFLAAFSRPLMIVDEVNDLIRCVDVFIAFWARNDAPEGGCDDG